MGAAAAASTSAAAAAAIVAAAELNALPSQLLWILPRCALVAARDLRATPVASLYATLPTHTQARSARKVNANLWQILAA